MNNNITILQELHNYAKEHDVSLVELMCLHHMPASQGALARACRHSPARQTEVTDRLIDKGLAALVPGKHDRRKNIATRTDEGRDLVDNTP